jgi:hypothetical protein
LVRCERGRARRRRRGCLSPGSGSPRCSPPWPRTGAHARTATCRPPPLHHPSAAAGSTTYTHARGPSGWRRHGPACCPRDSDRTHHTLDPSDGTGRRGGAPLSPSAVVTRGGPVRPRLPACPSFAVTAATARLFGSPVGCCCRARGSVEYAATVAVQCSSIMYGTVRYRQASVLTVIQVVYTHVSIHTHRRLRRVNPSHNTKHTSYVWCGHTAGGKQRARPGHGRQLVVLVGLEPRRLCALEDFLYIFNLSRFCKNIWFGTNLAKI